MTADLAGVGGGSGGADPGVGAGAACPVDRRRVALAGLLRCCEPPAPALLTAFVEAVGPLRAWEAIAAGHAPTELAGLVAPRLQGLGGADLDRRAVADLNRAAAAGAVLVGPGDRDWPGECFEGLAEFAAYDGCATAAPPIALYRRGDAWPRTPREAVSVVGSRSATPYGVRVATELGAGLVAAGYTVVSGAAYGIDVAAHRGALHADRLAADAPSGGVTVAVLACGIDRSYPVAHRSLLDAVATGGAVVSEYPPGTVPARHRFLVRNRLIAALGGATVVVEAGRRSGSLNTASSASALHRTVLAVPGPVTSAMSAGCHDLLRDHRADVATDVRDVVAVVGPLELAAPVHRRGDRRTDGLDLVAARVHDALPGRGSAGAAQLSAEAALPLSDVLGALATLEMQDLVRRVDGRWRRT